MKVAALMCFVLCLPIPALAQFWLPGSRTDQITQPIREPDPIHWKMEGQLSAAKRAILCAVASEGIFRSSENPFIEVATINLRGFAETARAPGFELPEYSEFFSKYMLDSINAPTVDFAVGSIFSHFKSQAAGAVERHESSLKSVDLGPEFNYVKRSFEVINLYRCDLVLEETSENARHQDE